MDEESTLTYSDNDVVISVGEGDSYAAISSNTMIDTITLTDMSDSYATSPQVVTLPLSAWNGSSIIANSNGNYYGNLSLTGSMSATGSLTLGDQDTTKNKIYIVEPWQSKNPIKVEDGLWVSLEKDLVSNDALKQKIMDRLEETNPEILIKMGINVDNMKLVKREVNIEINQDSEKKYK